MNKVEKANKETMKPVFPIGLKGSAKRGKSRICCYADNEGRLLITEINQEELPDKCQLKGKGFLQFYIDAGLDISNIISPEKGNCIVRLSDKPFNEDDAFELEAPVEKATQIVFSEGEESISPSDIGVTKYMPQDEAFDAGDAMNQGSGSKLFGWPFFTQQDPREKDSKYDTLLLQLDSDSDHIVWGDMGVGNFFINSKKLEKKDFSDVLFYWDCF